MTRADGVIQHVAYEIDRSCAHPRPPCVNANSGNLYNITTGDGQHTKPSKKEVFKVDCSGIKGTDPKIVFLGHDGDDYFEYWPDFWASAVARTVYGADV